MKEEKTRIEIAPVRVVLGDIDVVLLSHALVLQDVDDLHCLEDTR